MTALAQRTSSGVSFEMPSAATPSGGGPETRRIIRGRVLERDRINKRIEQLNPDREKTVSAESEQPLKIIDLPQFEPMEGRPGESLAALQEWEGLVVEAGLDSFWAELVDVT